MGSEKFLEQFNQTSVDYSDFATTMLILLGLVFALRYVYLKFSRNALSTSLEIANILPLVSVAVFLVTYSIRHSLALSLGLVGALSITRFRTPVKSAEDLAFLFMSIAVGVSLTAGQKMISILASIIFIIVYIAIRYAQTDHSRGMICSVILPRDGVERTAKIREALTLNNRGVVFRTFEERGEELILTFYLPSSTDPEIEEIHRRIKEFNPKSFTLFENRI